jgi:hypothetical protein
MTRKFLPVLALILAACSAFGANPKGTNATEAINAVLSDVPGAELYAQQVIPTGPNGTISALNANLATGIETQYSAVTIQLNGSSNLITASVQGVSYASTLVFQQTTDNLAAIQAGTAHWVTRPNSLYTKVSTNASGAISGTGHFTCPVSGTFARITCSSYVGGDSLAIELVTNSAQFSPGGGGSSVAQGTSPWVTSDTTLDGIVSGGALPVSGTFWQTTQPVSLASLPGGGATGSAVPATAIYNGGITTTSIPSPASAGNLTGAMFDTLGRVITAPQVPRVMTGTQNTTITASTAATTVVTAGTSGVFDDITSIVFVNSSATGTVLTLYDGASGTYTHSYTFYCPPTDMRGVAYQIPLAQTTAGIVWQVACTTSVSSIYVTVTYVTLK